MSKKDFRAVSHKNPRYPKASELTQSSLGKLGLAALGGLLLGGTAEIPQAHAEDAKKAEGAKAVQSKSQGGQKSKPGKKATDPSAPVIEPRFMPNGGKAAPRFIDLGDPAAAPNVPKQGSEKSGATTGTTTSTGTTPPERFPLAGKPMPPRMREEEKVPPKKPGKKAANKNGTGTDTSTDTAVPLRFRGALRAARIGEESLTPGEDVGTATKTETKTETKKEPEVLPPPGAPPLPRKPEPAPKKSK